MNIMKRHIAKKENGKRMAKGLLCAAVICLQASFFISCAGEEDDIFSSTAAERLNEASAKYSARLMAQPNGWAMQYYPTYADEAPYGSGYLILMDFDEDYSVKVAMDNAFSDNTYGEHRSPWEVITDNGPVLSFNGYNYMMHAFSDPEDIVGTEDNEQSEGVGGDYEFIIVDAPEDASYMMLKGKKRNTYNLLTPIEEGVDYREYLADVKAFHNSKFRPTELVSLLMHFGDSVYRMDGSNDGLPNIYPYSSDAIANESFHPFLVTKRYDDYYVRFRDPFERDDMEGTLQELRYDSLAQEFVGTENDQWRITGYPAPLFIKEQLADSVQFRLLRINRNRMSDKMYNLMNEFYKKLRAFANITLIQDLNNNNICWRITYSNVADYIYQATFNADEQTIDFAYQGPSSTQAGAATIYSRYPELQSLLEALSQSFKVRATNSDFDLSSIRMQAVADEELWFDLTYTRTKK